MLSPDEIRTLEPIQAQLRLQAACTTLFGDRWKTALARAVDMGPRQVNYWMADGNRPPAWAIMLAEAMVREIQLSNAIESLNLALAGIRDMAKGQ